ncbi:glucuronate isomerase [Winogradskyella forsetii]
MPSLHKNLPIIDDYNHLSAKQISENKSVKNMTEVWLKRRSL